MNRDLCGKPVKGRSSNPRVLITVEVHESVSLNEVYLSEYTLHRVLALCGVVWITNSPSAPSAVKHPLLAPVYLD